MPTREEIAAAVGVSLRTFKRYAPQLERAGILTIEDGGRPIVYAGSIAQCAGAWRRGRHDGRRRRLIDNFPLAVRSELKHLADGGMSAGELSSWLNKRGFQACRNTVARWVHYAQ